MKFRLICLLSSHEVYNQIFIAKYNLEIVFFLNEPWLYTEICFSKRLTKLFVLTSRYIINAFFQILVLSQLLHVENASSKKSLTLHIIMKYIFCHHLVVQRFAYMYVWTDKITERLWINVVHLTLTSWRHIWRHNY